MSTTNPKKETEVEVPQFTAKDLLDAYERGRSAQRPPTVQGEFDERMAGVDAAIAARPLQPERYVLLRHARNLTGGVVALATSRTAGERAVAVRLPLWVPAGSASAESFHPAELARVNDEIDQSIPERERDAVRALRASEGGLPYTGSLSREVAAQIESSVSMRRRQAIFTQLRLPLLQLVGKKLDELRRFCTYVVVLEEGSSVPQWHTLGQEPPADVPRFPEPR